MEGGRERVEREGWEASDVEVPLVLLFFLLYVYRFSLRYRVISFVLCFDFAELACGMCSFFISSLTFLQYACSRVWVLTRGYPMFPYRCSLWF